MTSIGAAVSAPSVGDKTADIHIEYAGKVIRTVDDVTAEWLSHVLKAEVTKFDFKRIGTGQVSFCFRSELEYAEGASGPTSIVLKLASDDIDSRTSAKMLHLYQREVLFYTEAAPLIPRGPVAQAYHSSYNEKDDTCCIMLEDISPCIVGNDIEGHSFEQAKLAMEALGRIHAPFIGNADFEAKPWLTMPMQLPQAMFDALGKEYLEQYKERIKPEHAEIVKRLIAGYEQYQSDASKVGPMGVVHADYRGDNILWKQDESGKVTSAAAVDWQTLIWGPVLMDVSYFLGCSLTTANRRAWQDELIKTYYEALGPDSGFSLEECKDAVKLHTFFGVLMAVVPPMLVQRTERGDDLFMTLLDRHCNYVLDLNALELLPDATQREPLKPSAEDDSKTHEPQPVKHWQESWYFDFIDVNQEIGGYVRLGSDPGAGRSWYTATICGPNRPTIAVVDFEAPVPDEKLAVKTSRFSGSQECIAELKEYRVRFEASEAEAYDNPADLLEGKAGATTKASLDLTWYTDGEPYAYRLTTRYEIPCTVKGKITIGDEVVEISGCVGQRDHSWGSRDWWAMDWIWSALHLDDGTRIHGLDLRIPSAPRMACGYIQGQGKFDEVEKCEVEGTFENGLPKVAHFVVDGKEFDFKALGHGPLRLVSDDGRVGRFPRCWGTVNGGVAWVEWMLNP